MLIVCPTCATSYNVDAANLHRQVRCARCRTVWHAEPVAAASTVPAGAHAGSSPNVVLGLGATDQVEWRDNPADSAAAAGASNLRATAGGPGSTPADGGAAGAPETPMLEVAAPPLVPAEGAASRAPIEIEGSRADASGPAEHEDIETYAARREREERLKRLRWPLSLMQSAALFLLIIDAVLIGWRDDMVRLFPQTASFYTELGLSINLRGLSFTDVSTTAEKHEGVPILVVEGSIVNDTRKFVDMPRLKFAVRNGADEEIYSWTAVPPRPILAPHESVAFRSRLASPPPDGRAVLVRFVTRQDLVAGGR
jgi:predicted Zn finger-like uncharacterized protein